MSDQLEDLVRDIAAKHGVAVGRDDPILIMHTLNEKLLENSGKAQQAALDALQSELEAIALRWGHDAREKAEKILNAALNASKEVMSASVDQTTRDIAKAVRAELASAEARVTKSNKTAWLVALVNLAASMLTVGAVLLLLLAARN